MATKTRIGRLAPEASLPIFVEDPQEYARAVGNASRLYYRELVSALKELSINGILTDTVPTVDLPAGSKTMDGRIIIEDAGAGAYNLVVYLNQTRRRIATGAIF